MRKKFLLAFLLFAGFASRAQIILNESFNVTTITATPPTGWTAGASSGTQNGCSVNGTTIMQVPSGGFVCTVNGANLPANAARSGSGMAGYNAWDIGSYNPANLMFSEWVSPVLNFSTSTSGYVLSFWVWQGQYNYNVPDSLEVYVNTTTSSAGGFRLYANNPNLTASPNGWAQYSFPIPATYNGTTNYIIFRAESGYGYNMHWDDVIVRSQAPPPPTVTNNTPVCPGGTITITGTVAAGYPNPSYTLTGPAGFTPQNNTTGVFTVTTNATVAHGGTYSMNVTSGGFTSALATTNVVVYNTPRAITAGNVVVPTTCLGTDGSFQICGLNPTTSYSLIYRRNATAITPLPITSDASGCYTVTGIGVGSYDSIRVISGAPGNCISNILVNPVIVPSPTPPTTPRPAYNSPVCPGSTIQLSVTNTSAGAPGSQYYWTGPGGFNTSVSPGANQTGTASRPNANSSFSGIYTVTVTTPSGCASQDTITVTVRSPDPAPIPSNVTYCQYDIALPVVATGLTGATLLWYTTPTGGIGDTLAPTPNTNVPTPFPTNMIFYVSQTLVCESPRAPLYVIVKPKPQPPFVQDSTIEYCQYEVVGPLAAGGANIRWFSTPTGGTGSSTAPIPSTLIPGTYFYYASQTVDGCESERRTIRVIVKPKPEPPKVNSPVTLCQGDPIAPLTAIGKGLLWYTIPSGGVGVPVAPIINTGYEDSFQYYVTQTVNGCESDRALISAFVRYKPNGIITASQQSVCQDAEDTFFYYGNARPDAEFVWFAPLSAHFVSGQGTPGPVVIHFDTAGTSVVQLIINNKGCISRLVAAPITVRPLPKIGFINRQDVCEDELVHVALNKTEQFITGYHWDFGSDDFVLEYGVVTTGGPFGVRYPSPGQYSISVTATKDACISKPIYQTIYVHARPDATISYALGEDPNDFCASDTLHLSVPAVPEGASYHWSPAAYFQGYADTLNNLVSAVVSQSSMVKVNVRSSFGCEANDSLFVKTKSCCGVYFPNSFSPNADGRNDLFRPITQGVHKVNNFRIINRWGQVVYESKIERNGWDGRYNEQPQDMGTYHYYFNYKCDGKDVEEKGEFILMR